jgi:uroporphyrinogen III methyltransferase/synthase
MGVTTVRQWTAELIAAGKPAETPAAIVRRCSFADQQTILCRLDEVAQRMTEPEKMRPPVIVVVGEVARAAKQHDWFGQRPLFGKRIVVTRPAGQCEALSRPLRELGAEVLVQPAIQIEPPEDWSAVDAELAHVGRYDWIVFSSANGVQMFLDRLLSTGRDMRVLGKAEIAAIGPGTSDELARYHLRADLIPDEFRAESLAEALKEDAAGAQILLVRASRGREVLADQLTAAGGFVTQVVAYRSTDVTQPDPHVAELLSAGKIDWMTVTSSAIARSLANLFSEDLRKTRLASISPITTATLAELGYPVVAEATEYTMPGVVQAIGRHS